MGEVNQALRKLYADLQAKVRDILLVNGDPEELDDVSYSRQKLKMQQTTKDIVAQILDLEEKIAKTTPHQNEAAVQYEIIKLQRELTEKNDLIKKTRTKLDKWTQELVPMDESD